METALAQQAVNRGICVRVQTNTACACGVGQVQWSGIATDETIGVTQEARQFTQAFTAVGLNIAAQWRFDFRPHDFNLGDRLMMSAFELTQNIEPLDIREFFIAARTTEESQAQ